MIDLLSKIAEQPNGVWLLGWWGFFCWLAVATVCIAICITVTVCLDSLHWYRSKIEQTKLEQLRFQKHFQCESQP